MNCFQIRLAGFVCQEKSQSRNGVRRQEGETVKNVLHPLIHTFPTKISAQDVESMESGAAIAPQCSLKNG
jgi:hypothetical protein